MSNWTPAPDRPGYRCKTIRHGPATIIIYRPILSEEEKTKAQERTCKELEGAMRQHFARKTRPAAV